MSTAQIDQADIDALAAILESEKLHHCRARALCFGLFLFSLVMLVIGIVTISVLFLSGRISQEWLSAIQLLTPMSAAVIGFFGSWWACQNCINSIERTLFAARAGRLKLFTSFLGNLQCADKKKRKLWMEMAESLVT
jgi:hypothetical protein